MGKETWVVDRIEGQMAVLVSDNGQAQQNVRLEVLGDVAEGSVLQVPVKDGKQVWNNVTVDKAAADARRSEGQELLDSLQNRSAPASPPAPDTAQVPGPREFL